MQNNIVIFKELTTEENLQEIEKQSEQYKGLVVDMNKPAERKKVKDSASLINDILKELNRQRIDKKKASNNNIDSEAKYIADRLEIANKPLVSLINHYSEEQKAIREAEKARQEQIELAFSKLKDSAFEAIGQTSSVIEVIIEDIQDYSFDPEVFQERTDEAVMQQSELLAKLDQMLKGAIAEEENKAKLEKLAELEAAQAKADAEAEQAVRDEKIRVQAQKDADARHAEQIEQAKQREAQAKLDAENAALQAEADKKKAIEQAKADQIAEQKRLADLEAEKLRKLEANKKHAAMVLGEIKDHIIKQCEIDEETAIKVVNSLRKCDRVTINY